MANRDRLSGLDAAFLHLESGGAHMHVAAVFVFDGPAPPYDDLVQAIDERLHVVPRYRQKLAHVPLGQGRPEWVDDPHFNARYHVRHSALPAPGGDAELERLAARLFALPLDRTKPLWEMNLVEGLAPPDGGERFAIVSKTHHALVDGVSGVDITSVLFDTSPEPAGRAQPSRPWTPRPEPTPPQLLARALAERAASPAGVARAIRTVARSPRETAERAAKGLAGLGAMARAGLRPAPASPLNVPIGPHRRYTWVDADLETFRAIKSALGGTFNDAVLATVTLALGRWLRGRGHDTEGLVLKAMVPISVRAETERGALGNRVAAMWAPLPVGIEDPRAVYAAVQRDMAGLKESGQAVGAQALTQLTDFAPPTILSQAARLQARQRYFNLVVTNVPGPQIPLYLLGRELRAIYPAVPLARNQALGVAVMSYNGRLGFGLLGDYDALPDLADVGAALRDAIARLAEAAGVPEPPAPDGGGAAPARRGA
ncbi:MAG TPA: wax ester/triacylglycerol synthase family O-acyltransferase, partial [Solirubrobacteraceae bacterium]|nr:wax ester/triacylglycerol synthase family O-acyltransferase [Solirubrobacteraceae bacterium]